MTAQQLYRTYQTLADSAAQPHLKAARFARLYWVCQIDWVLALTREPESERVRRAMQPFLRTYVGAGSLILYKVLKPACLAIRAIRADFVNERTDMSVTPLSSDSRGTAQQDPFRRATDDDPKYSEENDVALQILSDSLPLAVRVVYLTYPVELDMNANNTPMETEVDQLAILRRVIAEKDLIDEKYNRYQLLANRVIPTGEQPT